MICTVLCFVFLKQTYFVLEFYFCHYFYGLNFYKFAAPPSVVLEENVICDESKDTQTGCCAIPTMRRIIRCYIQKHRIKPFPTVLVSMNFPIVCANAHSVKKTRMISAQWRNFHNSSILKVRPIIA